MTYVLLAHVVVLILYIDTETDLTRPSYPRNSYISVRHIESTSESASVPLDRRFHDKGGGYTRDVDLAWANTFTGKNPPISRSFTELAGQTLNRIYRECTSATSRTLSVISPIGRLFSQATGARSIGYVRELRSGWRLR